MLIFKRRRGRQTNRHDKPVPGTPESAVRNARVKIIKPPVGHNRQRHNENPAEA